MVENISCSELSTDTHWETLRSSLDPRGQMPCISVTLRQLRNCGAGSVVAEEEYLDRDFTDSYSNFYSKIFKRHTKLCNRLHFFIGNLRPAFESKDPSIIFDAIQGAAEASEYLGFVVIRPLGHAPIGRAIVRNIAAAAIDTEQLLVSAEYEAHLLGVPLRVEGIPLTQQDSRVGACAQACLWMAGRHFHTKHRGRWLSTAAITTAATKIGSVEISQSLPAGSESLHPNNMIQALRELEREPMFYVADKLDQNQKPVWQTVRPHDIIERYVDSGIPVIIGLHIPPNRIGHAVLAVGHVTKPLTSNAALPTNATRAEFCEYFLVNDDQRGGSIKLPIKSATTSPDTTHNLENHALYLLIPLPEKVFISGEHAENIAWDLLIKYRSEWDSHKNQHGQPNLGGSILLGDGFVTNLDNGMVIARTYLTYGWKYKLRAFRNNLRDDFKGTLLFHELPRFVWVTEFGTFDSLNHSDFRQRRIHAHAVIDATSSKYWEANCLFHAPGFGLRWIHDPDDPFGKYRDLVTPILDDEPYYPKIRGQSSFDVYRP